MGYDAPGTLTDRYNICRSLDTINVEKDRLRDGPFCVPPIQSSSDDSDALFEYTGRNPHGDSEQPHKGQGVKRWS
jgi:hypothetical protein